MSNIRIRSVAEPLVASGLYAKAARFLRRADAMGLVDGPVDVLDAASVRRVAATVADAGVAMGSAARLAASAGSEPALGAALEPYLDAALDALEASPLPEHELARLERVLGADLLAGLLDVAPVSLQRYLAGQRQTPDAVADRAHLLTAIIAALEGTYNDYGVRRWFVRPRTSLDGASPRDHLGAGWQSDDARAQRVRALAESLVGFGAT